MRSIIFFVITFFSFFLHSEVLVDWDFSPYAGGYDLLFAHESVMRLEDLAIPKSMNEKHPTMSQFGRLGELTLYWFWNSFLDVAQHEVFGHGYRIRSLGRDKGYVEGYQIDPLGGGTEFEITPALTTGEFTSITLAGLEAEEIFAQIIKLKWMMQGQVQARQATIYTGSRLSPISYAIVDRNDKILPSLSPFNPHDIQAYAQQLNLLYPGLGMTQTKILKLSLVNLIDPTIYNAYYALFRYFLFGENPKFWAFPIREIRYLPYFTLWLAPYGPELALNNMLQTEKRIFLFYGKGGSLQNKGFGGAGLQVDPIWTFSRFLVGALIDIWRQPNFIDTPSIEVWDQEVPMATPLEGKFWGVHLGVLLRINLSRKSDDFQLLLQGGGKTKGYVPGYALRGSGYGRLGFKIYY